MVASLRKMSFPRTSAQPNKNGGSNLPRDHHVLHDGGMIESIGSGGDTHSSYGNT